MIKIFLYFSFFFLLLSCEQRGFQEQIADIRADVSKQSETQNKNILSWEKTIYGINILADKNKILAIKLIDSILKFDTTLNTDKDYDLHFVKGNIYYKSSNFKEAIEEYSLARQFARFENPKILVAKAGAYLKLKQFDTVLNKLNQAAEMSYQYYWNVGNYYEIIGQKDSAINNYARLYKYDTTFYRYCEDRIIELKNSKSQFLKELIYKDRERKVLLMY